MEVKVISKLKALALETRAPFLTVTIVPVVLGSSMSAAAGAGFNAAVFLLMLFGFVFLHVGTNVLNDYFDDKNGTDRKNTEFVFPFTGGSRLIQSGILKPSEVLVESIVFFAAGILLIGSASVALKSPFIVGVLAFALVSGVFYTAPPFKWAHRGLGEILIAINFGPVMVCAAYYAQAGGVVTGQVLAASVLPGLLAAAIVDINEFPDFQADKSTGKHNLIVRLGREKGRLLYYLTTGTAYLSVIAAVIAGILPPVFIVSLLGLPFTIKASAVLWKNYGDSKALAPACAMTVLAHLVSGVAVIAGVFFSGSIPVF